MSINLPNPWTGGALAEPLPDDDPAQLVKALNARFAEFQQNFERLSLKAVSGPQDLGRSESTRVVGATGQPAFQNSWQNYSGGGGWQTARFFKDGFGVVHLEGLVNRGASALTTGTTIFTLPTGYRPAAPQLFASITSAAFGWVGVDAAGLVTMQGGTVGAGGGGSYLSLSGITFRAG